MILLFLNIETKQTACEFSNYKAFWIISIHVTFKISNFMALCLYVFFVEIYYLCILLFQYRNKEST